MPWEPGGFEHEALGAPAVADLLGGEDAEAAVVVVVDAHGGGVGHPAAEALGVEAEGGIAHAAEALVEAEALEDGAADGEIAGVGFGWGPGRQGAGSGPRSGAG